MTVIGNWFHNNDLSGGTLQSCGSSGLLVINNVFANVAYHDSYSMGAPKGITLKHNVFRGNGGQGASGFCTPTRATSSTETMTATSPEPSVPSRRCR